MSKTTVSHLAKLVKINEELLLKKLQESGIYKKKVTDLITDKEKNTLFLYIQNNKKENNLQSLTLKHTIIKELKLSGTNRKINIEVRKKKVVPITAFEKIVPPPTIHNSDILKKEDTTTDQPSKLQQKKSIIDNGYKIISKPNTPPAIKPNTNQHKSHTKQIIDNTKKKYTNDKEKNKKYKSVDKKKEQFSKKIKNKYIKNYNSDEYFFKPRKNKSNIKNKEVITKNAIKKQIVIFNNITVHELAQKLSIKSGELIKKLFNLGIIATINQTLDQETVILIIEELGHTYILHKKEIIEETILNDSKKVELSSLNNVLKERPPIVTIMGHVDHGKTTLLDKIRNSTIANKEKGGITQYIGSYSVKHSKGTITFLDTPGHEAFTHMRSRGAQITDIIVLVIAADDGVMPQTKEAIEHSLNAKVPIIVAINKIDKKHNNLDKIKKDLSQLNLLSEDWGGDVMFNYISSKNGTGINELLDNILLQAEILELKTNILGLAKGTVIESRVDKGKGVVTSLIIQEGQLKNGDIILCGTQYGKVRMIMNDLGQSVKTATPSMPVEILGLSKITTIGKKFLVLENERKAKEVAIFRENKLKDKILSNTNINNINQLFKNKKDKITSLNIILKTDVKGSIEAIIYALLKLNNDKIKIDIIYSNIGNINRSDVSLAMSSKSILLAFNLRTESNIKKYAETNNIVIKNYNIIYQLINDIKDMTSKMLSPKLDNIKIGIAEVRNIFNCNSNNIIIGCIVSDGIIKKNSFIKIIRDKTIIYKGKMDSLKRFKKDELIIKKGLECGVGIKQFKDIKINDKIEVYEK